MAIKKSQKIIKWFDCGIFPPVIMLSVGFNYEEITKHLKKLKANDWIAGIENDKELFDTSDWLAARREIISNRGIQQKLFYVIIKDVFDFTDHSMIALAHELYHITQFVFQEILDPQREIEAVAYTHSHLMKQILLALRK